MCFNIFQYKTKKFEIFFSAFHLKNFLVMIVFFKAKTHIYYAVQFSETPTQNDFEKLNWLFDNAEIIDGNQLNGRYICPRREMITPWSTNAVEITQNMGINGILRIEQLVKIVEQKEDNLFVSEFGDIEFDPMLQTLVENPAQDLFSIDREAEPIKYIENIEEYNKKEGLALSNDEIEYLQELSRTLNRKLTDSEVFGFSQVNSEHCRHKIFNGTFIIDGEEKPETLFSFIKKTSKQNPNKIISAYKDNVAFIHGPRVKQFAPKTQNKADFFTFRNIETIISLKAETHNFPTTVEPFNGAATGSGGEIRDRMAGGIGSMPLAGTAVYMTSYPRLNNGRSWEKNCKPRKWLYQTPAGILIKASNGASDFGNKFGQPLICGSLLTFEHKENGTSFGFDKVIMLAGGVGYAKIEDSHKQRPQKGDKIVVLGGDNYRIGMGGGAVSSVATGEYKSSIELNAVQRSNPEMQKRVANVIRALAELSENPIVSIHDHGAGGHLNSLSELVEESGGIIYLRQLPIGDKTLSAKEIVGNESQERMGLIIKAKDVTLLEEIAKRERAPMYVVGEVTGDMNFCFSDIDGSKPIDMQLAHFFGKPPKTILTDTTQNVQFEEIEYSENEIYNYAENLMRLESVAAKDWLTNKVDRSVTGRVAKQQTAGKVQLPLNNLGAVSLDFAGKSGIATSLGHAPAAALINVENGSVLSVVEALTNIVWAPLTFGLKGVSLSANWMWPAKNEGENARLYKAVEALSNFVVELGINVPTGKDSLSMTQKYPDGELVYSPGTVIVSAGGEISDITKIVEPVVQYNPTTSIFYIEFSDCGFELGGSSFSQILNKLGTKTPSIENPQIVVNAFNAIQELINNDKIIAGHDISAGGLLTALLEMTFANNETGLKIDVSGFNDNDIIKILFSEKPAIVIQTAYSKEVTEFLKAKNVNFQKIGSVTCNRFLEISNNEKNYSFDINKLRTAWFETSYLLDKKQCQGTKAEERFQNFAKQELNYIFPQHFTGRFSQFGIEPHRSTVSKAKAAIIREKGVNGDREMAYAMHLAGFDVKDIHTTDLTSGRETLEDVNFIVFVGGFSNSDVLGSAKGWAGALMFNSKAKEALDNFYKRKDTLSLGVCNGCQLMVELGYLYPEHEKQPKMLHNESHKFESIFLTLHIHENNSVMLNSLSGTQLGIWVAHGEGKFSLPLSESNYQIAAKYAYSDYPANPNGSDYDTAAIVSKNGRHLAMMPHLERSLFTWNWAYYPQNRKNDQVTPWIEAFVNAREWVENKIV